jgi:predicted ArsR family transcriptional regulator
LRGAALYNPHLLSKAELLEVFQARHALLDRLADDLRATPADRPPQHHLVIGQRGMGKTMLLHRLAYAIEDDPELSQRWVPLTFPEEQYNVAHLSDFWLNCLDALSDRLERTGQRDVAADLDERIEALRKVAEKNRSREALSTLLDAARRLGRRVALLVDNVDLVFDRISGKEEWAFRDTLSRETELLFVGASAAAGEVTYDHSRAFYDFFQVHELDGLSLDETRRLLLHYAEVWSEPEVAEIVERHHARLRTLHTLTGGNPRTIVLLFNVLARGMGGDVRTDLEQLLDQCTPLYKARFEALPEQAQRVVHALAIHWDPISAGELAREMRLKVNLVSAQLNRLVQQGVVEKVPYHPATKTGFQIAERFFNIWYLMRASRRVRRRLIWLVEFLRLY